MGEAAPRNQHGIEPNRKTGGVGHAAHQIARRSEQSPLLGGGHRFPRDQGFVARFDLDDGQDLAAARQNVDLAFGGPANCGPKSGSP